MRNPNTLEYRGYEIDPIKDCGESWITCEPEEATCFQIFPPNIDEPCLDVEVYTLETAERAIDMEIDGV